MDKSVSPVAQREFLLSASAVQDSLLQSYRTIHVLIQGCLLGCSAIVFAIHLFLSWFNWSGTPFGNLLSHLALTALLVAMFWVQQKTALELGAVIANRSIDINHFHKEIILAENLFSPEQRAFTKFKLAQKSRSQDESQLVARFLPAAGLSPDDADALLGKGVEHTRRVLDAHFFRRLECLFLAMIIVSALVTCVTAYSFW
ncbi:MAG: hypothetical protein WBD13_04340 [Burkholderiaceae bacterium]